VSQSAAQADAFYNEILAGGSVWTLRDSDGIPAPETPEGRAMPFWSLRSRVERVISTVAAYSGFEVEEIRLEDWRSRWLPGLANDGLRVGINWSGSRATGFDLPSEDVERNLTARE
jgi:hypothetical protein